MTSQVSLPPHVSPLRPQDPALVGRYLLLGRLGSGGMGVVYAAMSPHLERVAIKLAHPDHALAQDFTRELDLMRRVEGVCGIGVYDGGTFEGRPWAAIEYVPGVSLSRHVREEGRFEGRALVTLAAGCAEALTAIHGAGVAHGDIKPGNVLVSPEGPKVVDYGIARLLAEPDLGRLAGSPGWLAPERYRGRAPDVASDVFAWGCLVAFAASGERPFGVMPGEGGMRARLMEMARRTHEESVDLSAVPEGLRVVVGRALSQEAGERPGAEEVYLECLVQLGEDRRLGRDGWAGRLRDLLTRHWPRVDIGWDRPQKWVSTALALNAAARSSAPPGEGGTHAGEPAPPGTGKAQEAPAPEIPSEQIPGPGTLPGSAGVGGTGGKTAGGAGTGGPAKAMGVGAMGAGAAAGLGAGPGGGAFGPGAVPGGGIAQSGMAQAAGATGTNKLLVFIITACLLSVAIGGAGFMHQQDVWSWPVSGEWPPERAQGAEEEGTRAAPEPDFPYVREGQIFQDTGQDSTMRYTITGLERTDEHTVLHYETAYVDHFEGINYNLGVILSLLDPESGLVVEPLRDGGDRFYGSVPPLSGGLYPVELGSDNVYRRYFPRLPDEVQQVTLLGSGLGAMTGIPVEDVDEERPEPTDPNGAEMADGGRDPYPGENPIEFENRPPDPGAEEHVGRSRMYTDSEVLPGLRHFFIDDEYLHTAPAAPFVETLPGEVTASEIFDDIQIDVHPLLRDGGFLISTLTFTNFGFTAQTPDLGFESPIDQETSVTSDLPRALVEGTIGGFQLIEPRTGLVRHVVFADFDPEENEDGEEDPTGWVLADEVHPMQPGNTYQLMAIFPAPPAYVTEMTLRAGSFGEFDGVPIQ